MLAKQQPGSEAIEGKPAAWRVDGPVVSVGMRGGVVIDKSFVIMVLACAAAPLLGAGVYLMVTLF